MHIFVETAAGHDTILIPARLVPVEIRQQAVRVPHLFLPTGHLPVAVLLDHDVLRVLVHEEDPASHGLAPAWHVGLVVRTYVNG